MKRTIPGASGTVQQLEDTEFQAGASAEMPAPPLRTEYPFELPRGYLDHRGVLHKRGVMRMATARDELLPLSDARVQARPAYLTVVLLARVITKLGELEGSDIDDTVIEELFAADLAFLQDLYRRINQEGHTRAAVTCPNCQHDFTVDVAGGRPGGS
jgi:hypothetical protein